MSITNYNRGTNPFTFKAGESFEYWSLKNLYKINKVDEVYLLRGLFINKTSKFGPQGVAVLTDRYVNLPNHLTETVNRILEDQDAIDQINDCKAGFRIYDYKNQNGQTSYSVQFVDIEDSF